MFGNAVRRDLHTGDHGKSLRALRQDAEALYATARLLYLPTGSLGTAARDLRGLESDRRDMKPSGSLHRQVLRRLQDTQVELKTGAVLSMPVATVSKAGGASTPEMGVDDVSEEYRDLVTEYYRALGSGK